MQSSNESSKTLKSRLFAEIKQSKWRESIDDEEYERNKLIFEAARQEALKIVREDIELKPSLKEELPISSEINEKSRRAYAEWKGEKFTEKQCPEVNAQEFLFLTCLLNSMKKKNSKIKREKSECKHTEFKVFWDNPSVIQRALRKCVLARDWDTITHISLIILHYDKKYLPIIQNMCRLMLLYNPRIKEFHLEGQFQELLRCPIREHEEIINLDL